PGGAQVELLRVRVRLEDARDLERLRVNRSDAVRLHIALELLALLIGHRRGALRQAAHRDVERLLVVAQLDAARALADGDGADDFVRRGVDDADRVLILIRDVGAAGLRGEWHSAQQPQRQPCARARRARPKNRETECKYASENHESLANVNRPGIGRTQKHSVRLPAPSRGCPATLRAKNAHALQCLGPWTIIVRESGLQAAFLTE